MNEILIVLNAEHIRKGNVIWKKENIHNTLHVDAQEFILTSLFNNSSIIPNYYYFGMDNRSSLNVLDTINDLIDEPNSNGYIRQSIDSNNNLWNVELKDSNYRALSNVITFSATSGSWGPVRNLFLTTKSDNSGVLLASVALDSDLTLNAGDSINLKMGISLRDVVI